MIPGISTRSYKHATGYRHPQVNQKGQTRLTSGVVAPVVRRECTKCGRVQLWHGSRGVHATRLPSLRNVPCPEMLEASCFPSRG